MASADVHGRLYERIIHGHRRFAVAPAGIRLCGSKSQAERDGDVLHQMVLEVTGGGNRQVDGGIARQRFEHVGQKGSVGAYAGPPVLSHVTVDSAGVQTKCQLDVGLVRLAVYRRHRQ